MILSEPDLIEATKQGLIYVDDRLKISLITIDISIDKLFRRREVKATTINEHALSQEQFIDELLEQKEITFGKAVHLVLSAAEMIKEDDTEIKAIETLLDKSSHIKEKMPDDVISLGDYALIIMQVFNMKGGILYSLFPNDRYAARELAYLGFLDVKRSPYVKISGEEALRIFSRVLKIFEE